MKMCLTVDSLLLGLSQDLLLHIFSFLEPEDVVSVACTCASLKIVAFSEILWEIFCKCRWHHLNTSLFTCLPDLGTHSPSTKSCYANLYSRSNGWSQAEFETTRVEAGEILSAITVNTDEAASKPAQFFLGNDRRIEIWGVEWESGKISTRLQGYHDIDSHLVIYSLACAPESRLLAGSNLGTLQTYTLHDGSISLCNNFRCPGAALPIVDLKVLPSSSIALALSDGTFSLQTDHMEYTSRNHVHLYDISVGQHIGNLVDHMDNYEIVCCAVAKDRLNAHDFLVGSVQGDFCVRCYQSGIPSLCFHKAEVHSAALCQCDTRAPGIMVARYLCQHRSMYVQMQMARQHYVFTSHAGTPLCVWDRRAMSVPLYQEERLPNGPRPRLVDAVNEQATTSIPHQHSDLYAHSGRAGLEQPPPASPGGISSPRVRKMSSPTRLPYDSSIQWGLSGSNPVVQDLVDCLGVTREHRVENESSQPYAEECTTSSAGCSRLSYLPGRSDLPSNELGSVSNSADMRSKGETSTSYLLGRSSPPRSVFGPTRNGDEASNVEESTVPPPAASSSVWGAVIGAIGHNTSGTRHSPYPMPLPEPARCSESQALWLESTDDMLLGRAENGMTWMWDLSTTLGWAREGQHAHGSWHIYDELGSLGWDNPPGWRGRLRTWPVPIGALPCETGLPTLCYLPSNPSMLIWHCSDNSSGKEYVTVTGLKR